MKAYDAFCALRDMPPGQRSIPKCVQALYGGGRKSAKVRQWQKWSKRYNWQTRLAAWQDELDRQSRMEQIEAVREMNRRHVQISMGLLDKAVKRLREMGPEELTTRDVLQYIAEAVRLERGARGEPETRTEETVKLRVARRIIEEVPPDVAEELSITEGGE